MALAIILPAEVLKALPTPEAPILPVVEVSVNEGVVMEVADALVMLLFACKVTEVLPVTFAPRFRAPAFEVRLTMPAVIVAPAELVKSPAVVVKLNVPQPPALPACEADETLVATLSEM